MEASEYVGNRGLLLLDTKQASLTVPTRAWFRGPASSRHWISFFEAGGYNPSPQDILSAPFYPDPSQRILALSMGPQWGFYITKVERLLRFARERAGGEIQWEEWKPCLIEIFPQGPPDGTYPLGSWVSGFRFISAFTAWGDGGSTLRVYDFSPHASMKFLHSVGDGCKVMHPGVAAFCLRRYDTGIRGIRFGHDSMVVELVSCFPPSRQLMAQRYATHYRLVPCRLRRRSKLNARYREPLTVCPRLRTPMSHSSAIVKYCAQLGYWTLSEGESDILAVARYRDFTLLCNAVHSNDPASVLSKGETRTRAQKRTSVRFPI